MTGRCHEGLELRDGLRQLRFNFDKCYRIIQLPLLFGASTVITTATTTAAATTRLPLQSKIYDHN